MTLNFKSLFELDRLNPIIVKELRQGNRSRAFLLNFLLAQGAMLIFVMSALASASSGNTSSIIELNGMFWTILGFFLIIGIPFSGLKAINRERSEARLDLLHLTRLSAIKIVMGKWLALVLQSCLITFSVVPYIISRYFYGGVNIVTDLVAVVILLSLSAFISGLSVSFSSLKRPFLRFVFIGGLVWMSIVVVFQILEDLFTGSGFSFSFWEMFLVFLIQAFFFLIIALEFSASLISPLAENHQSRIRLWYLLQLVFLSVLAVFGDEDMAFTAFISSVVIGGFVSCYSLASWPVALSSIYRPFVKRGLLGKLVGRYLLYPGYSSAVFYTLFCVCYGFGIFIFLSRSNKSFYVDAPDLLLLFPAVLGCLYVPLAIALLLGKTKFSLFNRFAGAVAALLVIGVMNFFLFKEYSVGLSYFLAWDPFSSLLYLFDDSDYGASFVTYLANTIASTALAGFLILRCRSEWRREEKKLELLAADLLEQERVGLANTVEA